MTVMDQLIVILLCFVGSAFMSGIETGVVSIDPMQLQHLVRRKDKAARILHAASDIQWDYVPSEFAAHLTELRQISRWRPPFNHQMNRSRRTLFIRVSGGSAPQLVAGGPSGKEAHRCYGLTKGP